MKKTLLLTIMAVCTCLFSATAQSAEFRQAQTDARLYAAVIHCIIDPKKNVCRTPDGTLHIFLFEDGNLLLTGYPTTATEKSKFQVHIFVDKSKGGQFLLEYTGSFIPAFNIQMGSTPVIPPAVPGVIPPINIERLDFAVLGPFTGSLGLTIKKSTGGAAPFNAIASTTILISKTIYASIGSGIVFTTLKNPTGIKPLRLPSGDSTLVADDAKSRSVLTVMATFYPWGRNNLMMPSWSLKDRFGIVIGTTIGAGSSNFKDLFVGGQYDFAIGGSIVSGLHYGRRQMITGVDYKDFKFGETRFTGDLGTKSYMQGDIGFFIGVQMDSRIFSQIFQGK
jgi:hypothetical protein